MLSVIRFLAIFFLFIPQSFAEVFTLSVAGLDGMNGQPGYSPAGSGFDGSNGFAGGNGGDGQRGQDGRDAGAATAGGNAGTLFLNLERSLETNKLNYFANLNGHEKGGSIDLNKITKIHLIARGGQGGNGGAGGSGQDGGRGGNGGDADQFHFMSGNGGRGGEGGNAGNSTDGANGGNGGSVVLQLKKGQEDLINFVVVDVSGGRGGNLPLPITHGGHGGMGGEPGNNCYFHPSEGYKCVGRGFSGSSGMDGRGALLSPRVGQPGGNGTYRTEVVE